MSDFELELGMRSLMKYIAEPGAIHVPLGKGPSASSYQLCAKCIAANPLSAAICKNCGTDIHQKRLPSGGEKMETGVVVVAINEDGSDGKQFRLQQQYSVIGRDADVSFPEDVFMSPQHAVLLIEDGNLFLEDLSSLNGTYVKLTDTFPLRPGDTFLMGRQVLRIQRFYDESASLLKAADGTRYMGSPPPSGRLKIEQLGAGGIVQDVYCLSEQGAVIGRENGDVVFHEDKFMSGTHAKIHLEADGEFYLTDQRSSNGSWLRVWERRFLRHGDFVFIGQQLLRVHLLN